ncbi:MAG: hypothetical protein KDB23_10055 [Planctomycetales bacterium]|nr:hypothetical protein [Planctomycetales bacterium]
MTYWSSRNICTDTYGCWRNARFYVALWLTVTIANLVFTIPTYALTQDELEAQRALWDAQSATDYDYVLQRECFCLDEARRPGLVQVRQAEIASVVDVETGQPLDAKIYRTIDQLFDELQRAIDLPADDIQTEFDDAIGYPTSLRIDFDFGIADEELVYHAREFRTIAVAGDYNGDGMLDIDDLELLTNAINTGSPDRQFDADQSGAIDRLDRLYWVRELKRTWIGDADLNGQFDTHDIVTVVRTGKYESIEAATWTQGDWNGDGTFGSGDFVAAFDDGGFELGTRGSVVAVPEPSAIVLSLTGCLLGLCSRYWMWQQVRRKALAAVLGTG